MAKNVLLQCQALTISQQIEELKNWHRQQQSKIDSDPLPSQKENLTEIKKPKSNQKISFEGKTRTSNNSSPSVYQNIDDLPIIVKNPNFKEILENNIPVNESDFSNPNAMSKSGAKPKFKFLKRGEGIARFNMGPQKIIKSQNKNIGKLNLIKENKPTERDSDLGNPNKVLEKKENENRDEILTLKPPDLKLTFRDWRTILNNGKAEQVIDNAIDTENLEIFQPNSSIDSSMASVMEKLIVLGRKQIREKEELRVFELMEQKVLDSSFCSTSSNIAKLMENAIMSTPEKKSLPNSKHLESNYRTDTATVASPSCNKQKPDVPKVYEQKRPDPPIWIGPEKITGLNNQSHDEDSTDNFEQSLHVRFSEKIDYKSFLDYSQPSKDLDDTEIDANTDFDENEEWKENSEESSGCCSSGDTSYSSSEEDVEAISPPARPPSITQNFPQDKQSRCSQNGGKNPCSQNKIEVAYTASDYPHKTKQSVPECDGMDTLEPVLSAKMKELENEMENFRVENRKFKEMRETLEKERKQFQTEKKKLLKEVEEERKINASLLKEEKEKLAKEKMIFEKYSKSLTKNPMKEERKEIQGLKDQLSEIKEEMNKKESRWAAAQARLRNQVKLLEENNRKLREEVEVLRKKSRYLEFLTHKKKEKPFNNTKLIHAISDHLSKIDIPDEEVKGHSNKKSNSYNMIQLEDVDPKLLNTVRVIREGGTKNSSTGFPNEYSQFSKELSVNNEITRREVDSVSSQENTTTRLETHSVNQNLKKDHLNLATVSSKTKEATSVSEIHHVNNKVGFVSENDHQRVDNSTPKVNPVESDLINFVKQTINQDGSVQKIYPDGRKEVFYKNGNIKKIDPLTGNEKTIYYNGDVEEILKDGTTKYYYSDSRRWQTTLPDGLEVWDLPNGQVEKIHKNGMVEIIFPDNTRKISYPDGSEEVFFADGRTLKTDANKRKVLSLPNGQREIHTEECVRREYPDGTVKKLYPSGIVETVYSNGRVRVKDKHGNLVMDSGTLSDRRS